MSTAVAAAAGAVGTSGTSTTAATTTTTTTARASSRTTARNSAFWDKRIRAYRAGTARWLTVIRGRPPRGTSRMLSASGSRRLARVWERREHTAWLRAHHPPMLRAWECIHHYEGSWTDHGAPYWGGLQMDYSFQSAYGPWLLRHKGTADHWTPLEQIWAGVRAWRVRGFSPWANTAHDCGVY